MASKNDITGDTMATKPGSSNFVNNFDKIDWSKKSDQLDKNPLDADIKDSYNSTKLTKKEN